MTTIRVELLTDIGTKEEQWNISRRFTLICYMLNKQQDEFVFDNQGLLTKSFPSKEDRLVLLVNKEIPISHEEDFYISKSIPTDMEDQELKDSAEIILEEIIKTMRR